MQDAIIRAGSYLKCDACPYVSPKMPRDLNASDVGTLCPDCGADMLTEGDFAHYVGIVAVTSAINTASRLMGLDTSGERVAIRTHMHAGKTTVTKLDA